MSRVDPASAEIGTEFDAPVRMVTHERLLWYGEGMLAGATGERLRAHDNIHTDEAYAVEQGLPGAIADGMLSTNWISGLLLDLFGVDYVERGELRTKYIKPVFVDVPITARARLVSRTPTEAGRVRYGLDVWAEDDEGTQLTVGEAVVEVDPRGVRTS